jgi:hypothetical protein
MVLVGMRWDMLLSLQSCISEQHDKHKVHQHCPSVVSYLQREGTLAAAMAVLCAHYMLHGPTNTLPTAHCYVICTTAH